MTETPLEPCPDCRAMLPKLDGPTHRYIGASAACWTIYSALGAGEPALQPGRLNALLVDAYAAQHPGVPSNQSIQSVAVHLLTLHGVLKRGCSPADAFWLRTHALRDGSKHKHERFVWLEPPSFEGSLSIADIVREPTPELRSVVLQAYIEQVWALWSKAHAAVIARWYEDYVVADKI